MVSFPNAKINIGLNIVAKRPDGYHNIESCFYPIGWTDILEIIPADTFDFVSTGLPISGNQEDNLCCKAYKLLQDQFDIPGVRIHLHKIIPMGAGLGGGSADGSFTLKMLNELFELKLTNEELRGYAAKLGSDCPFFVDNQPVYVEGTGNQITALQLDLTGYQIMLINPNIHISTQEAYGGVEPKIPETSILNLLEVSRLVDWPAMITNDFEKSFASKFPMIQELKELLYAHGAVYASMTGSGSTVFGIFPKDQDISTVTPPQSGFAVWSGAL